MTTRKLLSILLCFALLFSLSACQLGSKPVRPDPPTDWDEFLGRIIDPKTQTFHLPNGDIWHDTSDELLNYLELTEEDVTITDTTTPSLYMATSATLVPNTPSSFSGMDISYTTSYLFLNDQLWYETFLFENLTAADVEIFLESFQPIAQQITFDTNVFRPTVDEFVQGVKEESAINLSELPEEQQEMEFIEWTDEKETIFGITWLMDSAGENETTHSLTFEVRIDRNTFLRSIGVPVRETFQEKP